MIELMMQAGMMVLGLATHFLKDLMRMKKEGDPLTPLAYWHKFPYQSALCVIGSLVGLAALHQMGELSMLTAYGVGYMANSAADIVGKRTEKVLGQ